nr:hypothetical protein [Tanacetum cinerariifolium]
MQNPEDISDPTTVIDMALKLMAKAFQLNKSTPTNKNQQSSSSPYNSQIAQLGMNMDQDRQMLMVDDNVRNKLRQNAVQNVGNLHGNGNIVAAQVKGNGNGINGNPIRIQFTYEEVDFMAAAGSCEKTERANANCTLENNLQQASTSGTQSDKAPVYDSDRSADLLESIPEPHQVKQNDNNVILAVSNVKQGRGIVEQHSATIEEKCVYHESLFHNLAAEDEKVKLIIHKLKDSNVELTTELARYKNQVKCFEISQEKYYKLERKADESLAKHKSMELEIERLLRSIVSQDIMSIMQLTTAGTRVKTASESYYCQYKEVTTAQVEVSAAQELQRKMLIV